MIKNIEVMKETKIFHNIIIENNMNVKILIEES